MKIIFREHGRRKSCHFRKTYCNTLAITFGLPAIPFYVTLKTAAKVNTYPDSCFNNGSWVEYAKGVYFTRGDTLTLKGTFTKSNFKQKISGCYRIGVYNPVFLVRSKNDDSVVLQSLRNHAPVILKRKEKTICVQKPLN